MGINMINNKKKYPEIKPLFVKNDKGKTTHVYLDIKVYNSIFEELKEFEKLRNKKVKKQLK